MKLEEPLTVEELKILENFLAVKGKMTPANFYGYMCAVVSSPSLIPAIVWMHDVFGDEELFKDGHEAMQILNFVARIEHQVRLVLDSDAPFKAFTASPSGKALADSAENLTRWCEGYMQAITLDRNFWLNEENRTVQENLNYVLILAATDDILQESIEEEQHEKSMQALREEARVNVTQAVKNIYSYSRSILLEE